MVMTSSCTSSRTNWMEKTAVWTARPCSTTASATRIWCQVASAEYATLHDDLVHHRKTSIDPYGATNPAEFFAVVVEQFFEKPATLERLHPQLYAELSKFFRFDPAERERDARSVTL